VIGIEDDKVVIDKFMGLYSRRGAAGAMDDVPLDHARDCLNVVFPSSSHFRTRDGTKQILTLPFSGGCRRFFAGTNIGPNYLQPTSPNLNLLTLDTAGNIYYGSSGTPIYSLGNTTDFCAINMGNKVYIAPNIGNGPYRPMRLQVFDPLTLLCRDAAGLAPAQASNLLVATNSGTGNVPIGLHKVGVLYETDSGFWTPPGPKKTLSCTPTQSPNDNVPTIFTCTGHGMLTGESHSIRGGTGGFWSIANDTWIITRIDDNTFSIPLDSLTFGAPAGTFVVDAGFTPATVTADGTHGISITNIPIGPSFVKKRLIVATRANETEFFFVPNNTGSVSIINDNSTTSTTVNFFDTDLTASADYLFDIREVIPAGTGLCKYRGRLAVVGARDPGSTDIVFMSNVGDQETFSNVSGYVLINQERDGNDPRTAFVLRDVLYISKFTGTFSVEDNGNEPSTWPVYVVDSIIGSYNYGISTFNVNLQGPDTGDLVLIASRPGLVLFDGVMRRPELSWKIEAIWLRINFSAFHRVTVAHDPWRHKIYVACPLDSATEPNTLLVCDYDDGRDPNLVKWAIFSFPWAPTCIGMYPSGTPLDYNLKLTSIGQNFLRGISDGLTNDDGNIITSYYQTALAVVNGALGFSLWQGGIAFWKAVAIRSVYTGPLTLTIGSEDDVIVANPLPVGANGITTNMETYRQFNFVSEKMWFKMQCGSNINDNMLVNRLTLWGQSTWPIRPAV